MLTARVIGAERVTAGLALVPAKAKDRVKQTIGALTMTVLRKVKAEKLSGQVLRNQTGTLRRSINQRVVDSAFGITGSVGTNIRYAKRWELGYTGPESVKAHLRKIKQVWGKALPAPISVQVQAFTRQIDVKARPFLRPVLEEMRDEIRTRLEASVRGSLRGSLR